MTSACRAFPFDLVVPAALHDSDATGISSSSCLCGLASWHLSDLLGSLPAGATRVPVLYLPGQPPIRYHAQSTCIADSPVWGFHFSELRGGSLATCLRVR